MGHRAVLGLLFGMSAVVLGPNPLGNSHTRQQADSSVSAGQLVGTWGLVSRVVTSEDGTAVQDPGLGKTPLGYLIYDSSGHMAAQLMRPDRPMAIDCGTPGPARSQNSQSVNGYDAYFGTYTIDETKHTVTHHLEGALSAADVGKDLVREFQVSGDKLTIIVRTNSPNEKQIRTLTWVRVR
jgi:Lipocalin-like domain